MAALAGAAATAAAGAGTAVAETPDAAAGAC